MSVDLFRLSYPLRCPNCGDRPIVSVIVSKYQRAGLFIVARRVSVPFCAECARVARMRTPFQRGAQALIEVIAAAMVPIGGALGTFSPSPLFGFSIGIALGLLVASILSKLVGVLDTLTIPAQARYVRDAVRIVRFDPASPQTEFAFRDPIYAAQFSALNDPKRAGERAARDGAGAPPDALASRDKA